MTENSHGNGSHFNSAWRNADAFLFDIDGTLLNTRDRVHWNALHQAMFEAYGVKASIQGIVFHGKTDVGILREAMERVGIQGQAFDRHLGQALEIVCREVGKGADGLVTEICPAVRPLLESLASAGKLIGVASGNLETVGWCKLKAAGLREFFAFGSFTDRWETRAEIFRHALEEVRRRTGDHCVPWFIGDTPADIEAAHEVGGRVIAVCTGIFKREELEKHSPDVCVQSFTELLAER